MYLGDRKTIPRYLGATFWQDIAISSNNYLGLSLQSTCCSLRIKISSNSHALSYKGNELHNLRLYSNCEYERRMSSHVVERDVMSGSYVDLMEKCTEIT